jgi:hypothetical protein
MLKIIARTLVLFSLLCPIASSVGANATTPTILVSEFLDDPSITLAEAYQLIKCSIDQYPNNVWPYTNLQLRAAYDADKLEIVHICAELYLLSIDGIDIVVALEY